MSAPAEAVRPEPIGPSAVPVPPACVYGRLLGDAAGALHPRVRRLHLDGASSRAAGALHISRGASVCARVAAVLLRLPAAGHAVPTDLVITRGPGGERWVRHFGTSRALTSSQHDTPDGVLVERYGPLALRFTLTAEGAGLRLRSHGVGLQAGGVRLPLPRRLAPTVLADVQPADCGAVSVSVRIAAPLVGLLLAYEGHIVVDGAHGA